jgi:hypothetical protein
MRGLKFLQLKVIVNICAAPIEMRYKLEIKEAEWPQVIQQLCPPNHIEEATLFSAHVIEWRYI